MSRTKYLRYWKYHLSFDNGKKFVNAKSTSQLNETEQKQGI
jgi:hypothetical protein